MEKLLGGYEAISIGITDIKNRTPRVFIEMLVRAKKLFQFMSIDEAIVILIKDAEGLINTFLREEKVLVHWRDDEFSEI